MVTLSEKTKLLVLFDVDGTLLKGEKGTGHAKQFNQAFKEVCGKVVNVKDFNIAGKTDMAIATKVLQHFGLGKKEIAKTVPLIIKKEAELFTKEVSGERLFVLPGVQPLLEQLSKENCRLGVETGNPREIAFAKLHMLGIVDFFSVGGFGENVMTRAELVEMAISEAKKKFGEKYGGKNIVVIGDTRSDIESAKPFSAKSIAVATGDETMETLAQSKPDYVFNDLTNTKNVLEAILSD